MLRLATRRGLPALSMHARAMSGIATPEAAKQYRSTAEDKLLQHMNKIAIKAHKEGKLEQSTELYEHLVSARRARHGDRHPLTVSAIGQASRVAKDRGELHVAEEMAREAAVASKATLGGMHPSSLSELSNLASVLTERGKLDEAEATARVAIEQYTLAFGEATPEVKEAEQTLGQVLLHRGKQPVVDERVNGEVMSMMEAVRESYSAQAVSAA